jgi:hypothetical protein
MTIAFNYLNYLHALSESTTEKQKKNSENENPFSGELKLCQKRNRDFLK